jgi:hypothetical protein
VSARLFAYSISRPVRDLLRRCPFYARIQAVFDRACNLVTREGEIVALVTPQVGAGPLSIVVNGMEAGFCPEPGMAARVQGSRLLVGYQEIDFAQAQVWEPRPDWERLRRRRAYLVAGLAAVEEIARKLVGRQPRPSPLFSPSPLHSMERGGGRRPETACCFGAAGVWGEALAHLLAGWNGDVDRLREGAGQLAGRGIGLTPSGDDFLCGVILRAWLSHPQPEVFCRRVVDAAAPRTTTLSAAFLRAAGRGECNAAWQRLLDALATGLEAKDALARVLAYGATSGADTLAGFLLGVPPSLVSRSSLRRSATLRQEATDTRGGACPD